jgi:ATP-binding cassette subfamily B protein
VTQLPQGYETLVGERGVRLSGGQRQRIAIARALLGEPRVLILDDATSAVDSATEDRIQSAIERVRRGRTTFLITHRLALIRRADHVLVLRRGRLIDQGTHEELIDRCATYRRIFARAGRSGGTARAEGA